MTRYFLVLLVLLLLNDSAISQGTRQIASRKIKVVSTTIMDVKKGKSTIVYIRSEYDRKGRLILEKKFDADSVCTGTQTIRYNRRGDISEEVKYDGDFSVVLEKTEFYFDKFGRDTLKVESDAAGIIGKTTSEYNNLDQKIEESGYDKSGKLIRKTFLIYDKRGMLINRKTINESGETIYEKNNTYVY